MERSGRHCTAASDREGPCAPKLHYDRKQKLFGIPVKGASDSRACQPLERALPFRQEKTSGISPEFHCATPRQSIIFQDDTYRS